MKMDRGDRTMLILSLVVISFLYFTYKLQQCNSCDNEPGTKVVKKVSFAVRSTSQSYRYNRTMPLIFVGGVPRSGTTLMRAMLDAHPDVRCGQETRVIPTILELRHNWVTFESVKLDEAGVSKEVLNSAIASFCLEVIVNHGDMAPRLCNKDPLVLEYTEYLSELFPKAKFIFMVRDGRASVHSIITRQIMIVGFDPSSFRQCLHRWNFLVSRMHEQCLMVGPSFCKMVHYEQLVLHPAETMRDILDFLDVPWNENVLHHEDLINKPGGVLLAKTEPSTSQVIAPVNEEALDKWVGNIPEDIMEEMAALAPMLATLGYDPTANPPNYESLEPFLPHNDRRRSQEEEGTLERSVDTQTN